MEIFARVYTNAFYLFEKKYVEIKDDDGRIGSAPFSEKYGKNVKLIRRYFDNLIKSTKHDEGIWYKVSAPSQLVNYILKRNINPLMLVHRIVLPKTGQVLLSEKESRTLSPILKNGSKVTTRSGAFDMYYTHIIRDAVVINERIGVVLSDVHEWSDGYGGSGCSGIGMTSGLHAIVNGVIYSKRANYRHSTDPSEDRESEYMGTEILSAYVGKDGTFVHIRTNNGYFKLKKA